MPAPHHYSIVAADPAAHQFEVSVTVAEPAEDGQVFAMATWVPGSYVIRDMARNVVSISARCDGREVRVTQLDKTSWQADRCGSALTLTLRLYAFEENVRGAHLDSTHGFFDGACVFPAVIGQEHVKCQLEICAPVGNVVGEWRVATSLRPLSAKQYGFGAYEVEDYAELIDHPVEMGTLLIGEFEAAGIPHAIAVRGHARFDMARVCHDLATICEAQIKFLGAPDNLDRYLFLLTVQEDAYGGLEHRWSTALMCNRGDLPKRGDESVDDGYRKFLGLCSHEYFHLWNVKRMKPQRFIPYDLTRETHTGLLWVFEGITSYYDDLLLRRAGLISTESYLELMGKTITRHLRNRGNALQSVEASSFDAWTKFYKPHRNSGNLTVSYYVKGSLVALLLDLTIRKETAGRRNLDDVMRECWKLFGETGEGMPERGIEAIARSVSNLPLTDFFARYVGGTAELPLEPVLADFGIRLNTRVATGREDAGGKPARKKTGVMSWLGATLIKSGDRNIFSMINSGSPAEIAGIAPGDDAVAINGLRLTTANIDSRLKEYHPGDRVTITVFRNDELISHPVRLDRAPEDTCFLEIDPEMDGSSKSLFESWLGSN